MIHNFTTTNLASAGPGNVNVKKFNLTTNIIKFVFPRSFNVFYLNFYFYKKKFIIKDYYLTIIYLLLCTLIYSFKLKTSHN